MTENNNGGTLPRPFYVLTPAEIEDRWGLGKSTVHVHIKRGRFDDYIPLGLVRRSGSTWLIDETVLLEVYGEPVKKWVIE